jgi:hypothetical protein|nr:MAG TPA: hypothetical protein [Caudoviricetes sp.]
MWDELVSRASDSNAINDYTFTSETDVELFKERT